MAEKITAQMVKTLREQTGAGMMECKKALTEAEGDMSKAEMILVSRGQKKAQKSASRTAAEGIVVVQTQAQNSVMIEFNCETDFVAKDEGFNAFCQKVTQLCLDKEIDSVEALNTQTLDGQTVNETREALIAKIGENIQIRRIHRELFSQEQCLGHYVHRGRIGVQVLLKGGDQELAKDLAMHVAALNPKYTTYDDVPQEEIERQKELFKEAEKDSKKPPEIVEKIIEGKLKKVLNEECLIGQAFFKDPDQSIGALLKSKGAELIRYTRFEVGEGIEVKKMSFADEVAEQARGS